MKAFAVACVFVCACSPDGGGGDGGPRSVTLGADEGVDFATGEKLPGNFKADLYATATHPTFKLATGGANSTKNQPVRWFPLPFESLAAVPDQKPNDDQDDAKPNVDVGQGFVLKNNRSDGYTKGWVSSASSQGITIEYEPLE